MRGVKRPVIDWSKAPRGTCYCQCDRDTTEPGFRTRLAQWFIDKRRMGHWSELACPKCKQHDNIRVFSQVYAPAEQELLP